MNTSVSQHDPETNALAELFAERLSGQKKHRISRQQHQLGIDEFPSDWLLLIDEVNEERIRDGLPQLTYGQVSTAFLSSVNQLGLLEVEHCCG